MSIADLLVKATSTSKRQPVMLRDSTTGQGKTSVAYGSVTASYLREGGTRTAITVIAGTVGDAYSSGKWCEVDATNMPGKYQFHIPDAAFATGVDSVNVQLKVSGVIDWEKDFPLTDMNLRDATRGGMTALPNAVAGANSGIPIKDASGFIAAANLPAVAAGGTGGLFIAGTNAATTITTSLTTTFTGNLTGSADSVTGAVGSVTGAVGSVTGAVGSVTGAVGSVTGAVGSVTGAVTLAGSQHVIVDSGTVTTLTNAPADSSGVTEILTRLPDATAGQTGGVAIVGSLMTVGNVTVGGYASNQGPLYLLTGGAYALAVNANGYVTYANTAPLDAAGLRSAIGLGSANLDTQLADVPTVAEFNARSLVSADYFVVSDYTAPDNAGVGNIYAIVNSVTIGNDKIVTLLGDIEGAGFVKNTHSLVNITGSAPINIDIGGGAYIKT